MKKISIKVAHEYIKNYETTMKGFGVDSPEKGFTESVVFNKKELLEWMQKLGNDTKEIKIYFGIYPSGLLKADRSEEQILSGRFTTILWPGNGKGDPAVDDAGNDESPVNYGDLLP